MLDKRMSVEEIVDQIDDGSVVGIGGWGMLRKPMALVRAIARSRVRDLTVVAYGGPDVDLLIGAGKVKCLVYAYVFFDQAGLPPNFRRARESGTLEAVEYSEYMLVVGLRAASQRLPFLPTRSGLGSDVLRTDPSIVTIEAPYTGERLVAMPAISLDVALVHVNVADQAGYGQVYGSMYIDDLFIKAAKRAFLTAERLVPTERLRERYRDTTVLGYRIAGVAEAPFGAHFTSCYPDYSWDYGHAQEYVAAARSAESFEEYLERYVRDGDGQYAYVQAVGATRLEALRGDA